MNDPSLPILSWSLGSRSVTKVFRMDFSRPSAAGLFFVYGGYTNPNTVNCQTHPSSSTNRDRRPRQTGIFPFFVVPRTSASGISHFYLKRVKKELQVYVRICVNVKDTALVLSLSLFFFLYVSDEIGACCCRFFRGRHRRFRHPLWQHTTLRNLFCGFFRGLFCCF